MTTHELHLTTAYRVLNPSAKSDRGARIWFHGLLESGGGQYECMRAIDVRPRTVANWINGTTNMPVAAVDFLWTMRQEALEALDHREGMEQAEITRIRELLG